jgi:sugar phosphate isomerase/epimerase
MSQAAVQRAWFGVAAYSFPCSCGFLRRDGQPAVASPLGAQGLIDLALQHGLRGIEIPLTGTLPDQDDATIDRLRDTLADAGLTLVVDSGIVDVEALRALLPKAARAGALLVRATISGILEGARGGVPGGWDAHLAEIRSRIVALRPDLERHGLTLALENHQDATSDDLLALCEAGGERVGITFDVVNPLAVGEEPFVFARRLGPYIRNVHLKDYQVTATPSGYRLVRCALGEGVIDWAAMGALLAEVAPGAPQHIELAALFARHIRIFEDDWLAGFPPRDARELAPALRMLARNARPDSDPWQSPWERDAPGEEVAAWEREQFERSVAHLRSLPPVAR